MQLKYRSEIDGLRAIAIIPVILFHAGFAWFSGGYVGVDVFFVISGYLISSIILADLEQGAFSLANFYERRIRRILPALFFMVFAVAIAAWAFLVPLDLESLSKTIISVVLFSSNIVFWQDGGYFSPLAGRNFLLHTWSLAVEEQFYIFFPILLLLIWKYFYRFSFFFIAAATIASLALAQWASAHEPTANFFLLPTRAWELGIGALCALKVDRGGAYRLPDIAAGVVGLLGLLLIIGSVVALNSKTPIPGVYSLPPTIGAALVIIFATKRNFAGRILAIKPVVEIGLLSYSLYLWHQPLFAFAHQSGVAHFSPLIAAGLIGLAFMMAWASRRYVERPFRTKGALTRARVFQLATLAATALVAIGVAGLITRGGQFRFSAADQAFLEQGDYRLSMRVFSYGRCFLGTDQAIADLERNHCFPPPDGRPRLVIFGDSEAAHLTYGARQLFERNGYQIVQWTSASCRPIVFFGASSRCKAFVRAFHTRILPYLREEDRLIVAGNWGATYTEVGAEMFAQEFREGLAGFKMPGKIIILGDAPDFFIEPIPTIFRQANRGDGKPLYAERVPYPAADAIVRTASRDTGFVYFNPSAPLCPTESHCLIYNGLAPVYVDANHFSTTGSLIVMGALLRADLL